MVSYVLFLISKSLLYFQLVSTLLYDLYVKVDKEFPTFLMNTENLFLFLLFSQILFYV